MSPELLWYMCKLRRTLNFATWRTTVESMNDHDFFIGCPSQYEDEWLECNSRDIQVLMVGDTAEYHGARPTDIGELVPQADAYREEGYEIFSWSKVTQPNHYAKFPHGFFLVIAYRPHQFEEVDGQLYLKDSTVDNKPDKVTITKKVDSPTFTPPGPGAVTLDQYQNQLRELAKAAYQSNRDEPDNFDVLIGLMDKYKKVAVEMKRDHTNWFFPFDGRFPQEEFMDMLTKELRSSTDTTPPPTTVLSSVALFCLCGDVVRSEHKDYIDFIRGISDEILAKPDARKQIPDHDTWAKFEQLKKDKDLIVLAWGGSTWMVNYEEHTSAIQQAVIAQADGMRCYNTIIYDRCLVILYNPERLTQVLGNLGFLD